MIIQLRKTFTSTQFLDTCNKIYLTAMSLANEDCGVEFKKPKKSKSWEQIKGVHKLCEIYQGYIRDTGINISFKGAKEELKYKINYLRLCNEDEAISEARRIKREKELEGEIITTKEFLELSSGLQKYYKVPASFEDATLEEMQKIIEDIHELGRKRKWHNLILTSEEMKEMINFYNKKEG